MDEHHIIKIKFKQIQIKYQNFSKKKKKKNLIENTKPFMANPSKRSKLPVLA